MSKTAKNPADFILPLYMNGLAGRMLRMPPPRNRKRELLIIYGHHSSLERIFGIAEYVNKYGGITIPDLPGFGGMDPFYKIGEQPSLDNMADYLASFIKLRFRNRKFDLIGLSLGFMIITRMLQKYPEIAKQVNLIISFAGFTNKKDFKYSRTRHALFRILVSFFSMHLPASLLKNFVLRGPVIKFGYGVFEPVFVKEEVTKIRNADEQERKKRIEFEVKLWKINDIRTYMYMAATMLNLNLRGIHVEKTVYHIAIKGDRYFDNVRVEQHMREIYKNFELINARLPSHAPSVIATAKEAAPYLPVSLRRILRNKS